MRSRGRDISSRPPSQRPAGWPSCACRYRGRILFIMALSNLTGHPLERARRIPVSFAVDFRPHMWYNPTAFLIVVSHQYHTNAARSAQDLALLFLPRSIGAASILRQPLTFWLKAPDLWAFYDLFHLDIACVPRSKTASCS